MTTTRPVLRWHGGKWKLAPWIISHFPAHRVYVEPFGGAASVLLRKPRAYAEIYNDLDDDLVNLFQILRVPEQAAALIALLRLTPFARSEFEASYARCDDPIEKARRMIARSFMGFGSDATNQKWRTGFRAQSDRAHTTPAHDWAHYPDALALIVERLAGVVVERRDAALVMSTHDRPETLHYVDPPYVHATRRLQSQKKAAQRHAYKHEMSDAQHVELIEFLTGLGGMVALSGYPHPLYDDVLGWRRVERKAYADGARERLECLWLNPQLCEALDRQRRAPVQLTMAAQ